ncbi:PEP-CTERM sorting domain-containing protein [Hydrocoleum sp. CS-953]|uniref:PEP-CTERM sorting domain-containing protein n=1 Tax=Hydrocoleum sp. CS-953 TaxID=1671698 RepID=UPI001AEF59D5|nr:PEP-CTERM sorting domain-containing protein [Hydrocoleum sp. CS-953]
MKAKLFSCVTTVNLVVSLVFAQQTKAATLEFFDHNDFVNSTGKLTVIDFDDLPTGNGVLSGDEFGSQGLIIVQREGLPINVLSGKDIDMGFPGNVNSKPNVISSSFILGNYNNTNSDNFDFLLANPSFSAGLWIGNTGSGGNDTTEVQFLDNFGQVIANEIIGFHSPGLITGNNIYDNRIFYGIMSTVPIATIRTIEPAFDGDGITYDDIQFDSPESRSVPEPSSIFGLFLLGGFGIRSLLLRHKQ